MTPRQVLAIVAARWKTALALFLLIVGVTFGVSKLLLTEYTASASVMLDPRSPDQIAAGVQNGMLPAGYMSTQADLIASERVARGVITALGMDKDAAWRQAWMDAGHGQGDMQAWMAEMLLKKLVVKPAPVSNVVTISYVAAEPERAARVANAFVKAYTDASLEFRVDRVRQYGGFFDERAKQLRETMEGAQKRLSDYQQANSLITEQGLDLEVSRLSELSTQLAIAQGAGAEMAGRQLQARRSPDQMPEISMNPLVSGLGAELAREEARLQELTARLGESHPQLIEQAARVSQLKSRLASATSRAAGAISVNNSANQSRIVQVSAALEAQRTRVLRLQRLREQSAALQRDVDTARSAYESIQQRVSQSGTESQNTHTNVAVLKHASVPMEPSSPKLLKNLAAGALAGLIAGVGLVLGLELLDRRLRTKEDVAELKQPLLIRLPDSGHERLMIKGSRAHLTKRRVLTGLPRPSPNM